MPSTRGSPPPTRGLRTSSIDRPSISRITPAHAGTTFHPLFFDCFLKDHPRPRGDYRDFRLGDYGQLGSPPPTRGLQADQMVEGLPAGITPAHAGTTCVSFSKNYCIKDHPRPRGDYLSIVSSMANSPGSPPPTRGLLRFRR